MKTGDLIKAVWTDGLVAIGKYSEKRQGYIILLDEQNNKIVCDPNHVSFEIVNKEKEV